MLTNKISYKWNNDGLVGCMPLVFGLLFGMVAVVLIVNLKPNAAFKEDWVPALAMSAIATLFLAFSAIAFLMKRSITLQPSHYLVEYSLLGIPLYRKHFIKSDYQLVYAPKVDIEALTQAYGDSALIKHLRRNRAQTDDTGACWLISATDFNKRVKICSHKVVAELAIGLPYDTNEAFLMAFFQLPCVNSYDDVPSLSGEVGPHVTPIQTSHAQQSESSTLAPRTASALSDTLINTHQPPQTHLAAIGPKPKGTFKIVSDSDTVRLANRTGIYAGVTLFVLVITLMLFGAIPPDGILVLPVFVALMLFRETITLTCEEIEACVGFPFLELERVALQFDQITVIRTYATKAMGHEMVVLELMNDKNKAVRLPQGMTGFAGKMIGLSRLTMAEALWLSKKIKARMPASLMIKVIEESLWD